MAGNYPPGMSARDFVRAGIDQPHSHEHEWVSGGKGSLEFDDGAAKFSEDCNYTEGRYGDSWSCNETRTTKLDVERVVKLREDKPDVAYLASSNKPTKRFGFVERLYEDALVAVEFDEMNFDGKNLHVLDVDPWSHVRVRVGDKYEVIYQ